MDSERSLRVLIVDDSKDSADSLAALARMWGHEARVAYGGMEAIGLARAFLPDVVLLDLVMPGMEGTELAQELRQHVGLAKATFIAVTGYPSRVRDRFAADPLFDDYFIKPVPLADLRQLLKAERSRLAATVPPDA